MSSRSDWLLKSLQPLTENEKKQVWASRQYLDEPIETLGLVGNVEETHSELKQGYPYNKGTTKVLVINSQGGDVMAGLHLGGLVHEYQLNVVVHELCARSLTDADDSERGRDVSKSFVGRGV